MNLPILTRINRLRDGITEANQIIQNWEHTNKGRIPRELKHQNLTLIEQIDWFCQAGDWTGAITLPRSVKLIVKQGRQWPLIDYLAEELRPLAGGINQHWVIPEHYKPEQVIECSLVRTCYLLYQLTNYFLGPMASGEVRGYFTGPAQIEYRQFPDYGLEQELKLKEAGLKLVDPGYSQRHARDFWDQDDLAAWRRGDLDILGRVKEEQ